jgi:hypothetical protein
MNKKVENNEAYIDGLLFHKTRTAIELEDEEKKLNKFYNVPSSPATDTILKVIGTGSEINSLPSRNRSVNHNRTIEVYQNGQKRQIVVTGETSTITLELSDIDKLIGTNKQAKKMFILSLIKTNEQAFSDGSMRRNFVQFPLQELIDIGYYSRPQSARKGFNDAMEVLTSLKVKGTLKKGKKNTIEQSAIEVLFTGANIKKGTCTIFLNERINWGFVSSFYTVLPRYYFRLSNRASDLLYYIFYIARQRTKDIESRGYFTISMRAIQERLNLPSEIGNANPDRTIKKPIEDAVEAIEEASNDKEFNIELHYKEGAPIASYLSNGYLKIELKGEYAKDFIALSKEKAKQIEKHERKKEEIIEKAIIKKVADNMEKEEKK